MSRIQRRREQSKQLKEKVTNKKEAETGSYPSRSEIHQKNKKKKKEKKVKYPLISLLAAVFILLPGTILFFMISSANKEVVSSDGEQLSGHEELYIDMEPGEENDTNRGDNQNESSKETEQSTDSSDVSTNQEDYRIVEHIVGPKETLYQISMKYYHNRNGEELIREYNNLDGNEVYEDQVLKIPLKK
ncbi:LysM peptidoglycan-binding domain-containing protein [Metabacillus arenae]|uniref:LysM peptidoglycan-binding domain-containing protein n=1 Tax=Metabacillus arenae TaxID=2771434 RepID=A0A926ND46_9BACI|nr:LysM peptidoglycan-binding domain-containing protein [Metabacillus arenae]MBD1378645.1 LysM peptidoglycan-binding domain-containing protein [Metabacillus arenae]